MRLTVDNLDGRGAVEYSANILAAEPVQITRSRGERATLQCGLTLAGNVGAGLSRPVRGARIVASAADGSVLFAGSLTTAAVELLAGAAAQGPVYRLALRAVSDADVLARQAAANTHACGETDAVLTVAEPAPTHMRELAADVTVTGLLEPAAYVQEYFAGDGTTAVFNLTERPFGSAKVLLRDGFDGPRLVSGDGAMQGATGSGSGIANATGGNVWSVVDAGGHLSLGTGGLRFAGGTGLDGQTALTAVPTIEMGGALVVEATGVQLDGTAAQAGILCGLYRGAVLRLACCAGWSVNQSGGVTSVVPLVQGAETGTAWTIAQGHLYTLRIRVWSATVQRVRPSFTCYAEGVLQRFGGGLVDADLQVSFEALDEGVSSNTPATVLYQGSVADVVATANFAAVNALSMTGAVRGVSIKNTGTAWATGITPSGEAVYLLGATGGGADAELSASGTLNFFAGRIPAAGTLIRVRYRVQQRAVARLADPTRLSGTDGTGFGDAGWAAWSGRALDGAVTGGAGRSSQDCEAIAQAVLGFASSRAASISGTLRWTAGAGVANAFVQPGSPIGLAGADVFPGDIVLRTANAETTAWLTRRVVITGTSAAPEALLYEADLTNDWAAGIGATGIDGIAAPLTLEDGAATDAIVPESAATAPATVLADLTGLSVVTASGTAIQVDAGQDAPSGGGFEIRHRDWGFGSIIAPGAVDADLLLRSPTRSFSLPRTAVGERFYIRIYDASTPRVYSRWSTVAVMRTPLG